MPPAKNERLILFRSIGTAILCAFFVSGSAGLIHEVAWTRLLRLVMGNTTFSITTVLCAFMGGLALGSYVGGRIIDRRNDPLRVFSFLEGTIAVYCFLLPWFIEWTEPLYRFIYQNTHTSFYLFSLIRFLFSGLLLLIPATFMGATLPVLTRFFVRSPVHLGWSVGTLYGVNTFGAVLGAFSSGFIFIPALGVSKTIYLACLLNGIVSTTAYLMYRRNLLQAKEGVSPKFTIKEKKKRSEKKVMEWVRGQETYGDWAVIVLLLGYGFSGFASLVYEIAWTRALSLLIGSSVYAFSMMLTAFVLGIAFGSTVYAKFTDRLKDPMRALAMVEVAIGVSALLVVPFIENMPFFVTGMISRFMGSFWLLQLVEFIMVLLIMLIPTTLMGAAFPLANRIFARRSTAFGSVLGTVYGSNTLGTILGSFMGGFILIPLIGIQHTIYTAVCLNVMVGCVFLGISHSIIPKVRIIGAFSAAVVVAATIGFLPSWDAGKMSFGPYNEAVRESKEVAQSPEALRRLAQAREVIFHKEGLTTTVTVKQFADGTRTLYVNGKPDASSSGDLPTQELVAHIPLLLHPNPKSALVIGLASGISLGSAGRHPLKILDCVEISPAMLKAARYFDDYNYQILGDPRVNILIEDGRNHMALTNKKYDVVISQPSNPWIAGIADLFTHEYFQLCRDRLNPNGIVAVWVQTYSTDLEIFQSILRSFQSVFPNTTLWRPTRADCLLIGTKEKLMVGLSNLLQKLNETAIAADLSRIHINTLPDFLGYLVMGQKGAMDLSDGAPIHTDDNAFVEFASPRALVGRGIAQEIEQAIEQYREPDLSFLTDDGRHTEELEETAKQARRIILARGHAASATLYIARNQLEAAYAELKKAIALNPPSAIFSEFVRSLFRKAKALIREGREVEAIEIYRMILAVRPESESAHFHLGIVLAQQGFMDEAITHFTEAARLNPKSIRARHALGDILLRQGKVEAALKYYREALNLKSDLVPVLNNMAWLLATDPDAAYFDAQEALRLAKKALKHSGDRNPYVLSVLSVAYAATGQFSEAIQAVNKALELVQAEEDQPFAAELQRRIMIFEKREPYRIPERP